ncbi:MAG: flagellar export protein FliJ [Holophagales bacterium]|jgi:flagellar export protein FliJ|nr:flagellar export protein FliJ [Holophagales bacterium]
MAKQFTFRLASLLKIREAKKKDAQRLLGKLMGELQNLSDSLESLKELQNETIQQRRVKQGQSVNMELWRSIERFLVSIERKISETSMEIARVQILVDEARQALTKAHREHLTLLRLKERRQAQYNFEVSKEEQQQADELAVLRYQFKSPKAS